MLLGIGVEHAQLYLTPGQVLQEAPGRKGAAEQVMILTRGQFGVGGDAEEVVAEQADAVTVGLADQRAQTLGQ
ncbi:MAG TPA: hypothetical protein DCY03_09195 [Planctomycetaceae bacterium]|nr:hypothetical protein [Planctomycetaceae bacterium]